MQGASYRARMAAVDVVQYGIACVFSTAFLKGYWWGPLLSLANDPVSNVRLRVSALLPLLKRSLRLPDDVSRLVRKIVVQLCSNSNNNRSKSTAAWGC